jgi:hypothetical protein
MNRWAVVLLLAPCAAAAMPGPQEQALIDVFDGMGGKAWKHSTNWGSQVSVCLWFGVTCDASKSFVSKLELGNNLLVGTIPSSISNLVNLT